MNNNAEGSSPTQNKSNKLGIGLALGLVIGAGLGILFGYVIDNLTLGLILGAGGGLVIGLSATTAVIARS
jgi:F0F1-type ATP synthase assembly protein I